MFHTNAGIDDVIRHLEGLSIKLKKAPQSEWALKGRSFRFISEIPTEIWLKYHETVNVQSG
ncbi:hypothetical protein PO124_33860 [Bacillus licheniformis]|nr:hypothetical protein [Bacillus licheniformis]